MRALLVAVVLSSPAWAQPMDLYGFSPRSVAMGGVQAAADGQASAAYYNPALLGRGSVGVGYNWGRPFTFIEETAAPTMGQMLTARQPVDYSGITFDAAVPLQGLLEGKAFIGFDLYVPVRHVFRAHIIDDNTAWFLRYDNAPERFQIALSAGARPVPWLSVGGGVQVLSNYGGYAEFEAVLGTMTPGRVIRRRLDSEVLGVFAPVVGLAVGPFDSLPGEPLRSLKLSGFWRGEMKTTFEQPIAVDLGTFGALDVLVKGVTEFSPHTFGVGLSSTLLDGKLLVAADLGFERWSVTPPLVPDIHIDLPQTLKDLGFNGEVESRDVEMGFADVWVPRLGVEWRPVERLAVRAGYVYRPTPAPDQSGRTNFLDSTAHLMSLGGAWTFDDPLRMAKGLTVEGAAQLTALNGRAVEKQGNNVNPNYRFGGSHLALAVAVRYGW
jgi:long-chain fatty acid transport protein